MHRCPLFGLSVLLITAIQNILITGYSPGIQEAIDRLIPELQLQLNDAVLYWNLVTLHICANDYNKEITPKPEQAGPTATSRAFAVIHGAMHDAMTTYEQTYKPIMIPRNLVTFVSERDYYTISPAVMEAAYLTLKHFYPAQIAILNAARDLHLKKLTLYSWERTRVNTAMKKGQSVASYFLTQRLNDGSNNSKMYTPHGKAGFHRQDPTNPGQGFLGANWGAVKPFLLDYAAQYRPSEIVGTTAESRLEYLSSAKYIEDHDEIIRLGGRESTERTKDQTDIGNYWAYDGASKIGVPPRLYNQVVRAVAIRKQNKVVQNARLFALVNYALADAGIACWEAKYYYQLWRPIVGIREGSPATPPLPDWIALGAGTNDLPGSFTPGFPSYVSGHSTFGSACFETLRLFYGTDNIVFEFQSDEFNGKTIDSVTGETRPKMIRQYETFTEAEMENFLSRIYLGVHWRIDQEEGLTLGRKIAQHIFNKCK